MKKYYYWGLKVHINYMDKDLRDWLEIQFYKDNLKKYHHYFNEWVSNITNNQISGLHDQMIGMITKSKIKH